MQCIEHTQKSSSGYGRSTYKCKPTTLHRIVYVKHNNLSLEDIDGEVVRHTCDNPRCINPKHLVRGTQKDNMRDMQERGRQFNQYGVANHNSKLTMEDVAYIRENYKPRCKMFGGAALARRFGLHPKSISPIIRQVNWRLPSED